MSKRLVVEASMSDLGACPEAAVDLRWQRRFRAVSAVLSASVVAIGLVVLVGWSFDIALFKSVFPVFTTMRANAAVLFVVLGAGLGLARSRAPRAIRAKRTLGLIVALGAAVTLAEYVFELDLGIDQLLFRDKPSVVYPGRMSPATGLTFLLLGLGLFLQDRPLSPLASHAAGLLAGISALIALFGYLYGAPSFYAIAVYRSIALHTAVAFLLAASAFVLARPTEGIMRLLTSDSAAGRLLRRLLPAILLVPVSFGWVQVRGQVAGYYDERFGVALMTLSTVIALTCLSSIIATSLHRSELRGRETEAARQRLITRQKLAEAGRERQLREMVENDPHAVALLDGNLRYAEVSPRWLRDFGLGPVIGKSHYELFPELPEHWKATLRRCLAGATEQNDGEPFRRQDGRVQWIRWKVCPWRDLEGMIAGILIYSEDITAQRASEEAARATQDQLRLAQRDLTRNLEARVEARTKEVAVARDRLDGVISMAADAIIAIDADQRIAIFNRGAEEIFGWTREEVVGKPLDLLLPAHLRGRHRTEVASFATEPTKARRMAERSAVWGLRKNGEEFPAEAAISKQQTDGGWQFTVILRDVTARRRLENEQARIHAERAVLLKEIHHRVKNNLQVISSLFYLQAQQTEQENVCRLLDESRGRLQSIALIHEKLYRSEQLASIDFSDYLRDLTENLTSAIGAQAPHVQVRVEVEEIFLDIDRAIPCALIVNELVSNSMKHAFPGGRHGEIRVAITRTDSELEVEVSDTGIGFPADLDFQNVTTLGLQLVMSLTKQLRGAVELVRGEGTTFRIHVPAHAPAYGAHTRNVTPAAG